jgi:hypothetical protein
MPSVSCRIKSKKSPDRWVEVEIGIDDSSGDNFWKLTGKSAVSFAQFKASSGRWDPIVYSGGSSSGAYWSVPSILLWSSDPDPLIGFTLFRPGSTFYRLGCGQVLRDEGSREGTADLTYRMDFLCV